MPCRARPTPQPARHTRPNRPLRRSPHHPDGSPPNAPPTPPSPPPAPTHDTKPEPPPRQPPHPTQPGTTRDGTARHGAKGGAARVTHKTITRPHTHRGFVHDNGQRCSPLRQAPESGPVRCSRLPAAQQRGGAAICAHPLPGAPSPPGPGRWPRRRAVTSRADHRPTIGTHPVSRPAPPQPRPRSFPCTSSPPDRNDVCDGHQAGACWPRSAAPPS